VIERSANSMPGGDRRGYTILELVLVLAILAIAMVGVAPSLSTFAAGRKAEESAARFLALTNWARSQAVADGVAYELVVEPQSRSWSLQSTDEVSALPGGFTGTYYALEGVLMETDIAPTEEGQRLLRFEPSGRCGTGSIIFSGPRTSVTVKSEGPLERFHIISGMEEAR
jgi:general secretion pathway protein H